VEKIADNDDMKVIWSPYSQGNCADSSDQFTQPLLLKTNALKYITEDYKISMLLSRCVT